ncbi:restriction endonuclease subunit S [Bifidobacterium cebidarum]|uniref:Type I restriction-modification system, subunit S n=1 Tax=Bifidobacterium cebidarum TaxID=2650773 RepID=A0A6I1GFE3_9BIFI|nr:restriction endonuclease subunit S [Bifidobacterium cebidarum]KAB7788476.1 type I restriction-modification system, subunit S [Bifidobacterium cebidarum]
MNDFELRDVCTRLSSGKGIRSSELYHNGKYPVIGGNGERGRTETYNFDGECAIIGRQGANCGNVRFFIGRAYMTEHAVVAQANDKADTRYLAYLLSTMHLGSLSAQSAQPGLSVKTLSKQVVSLPSLTVQRQCSKILSSFDQEINNLHQTNGHLLELLKIEFAHRFENEDTPISDLGSVVSIWKKTVKPANNPDKYWEHYSIPAFDAEQYPSFELGNTIKSNKYEVVPNSVLVSKLNPTTRRLWLPQLINDENAICSTEFIEYVPDNEKDYSFYCSALMQDRFFGYLEGHVTGSTGSRQRVHPNDTLAYTVPNPNASEIQDYCKFADPVIRQIRNASIESRRLTMLRDALLPKLMSGEIDVSKIELPTLPTQTVHTNGRLFD